MAGYNAALRSNFIMNEAQLTPAIERKKIGNQIAKLGVQGDYNQAIKLARHYLITIDQPRVADLLNIAALYMHCEDYTLALQVLHHALAIEPDHVKAHYYLGYCHLYRGDLRAGWPEFEWRYHLPETQGTQGAHSFNLFKTKRWTGLTSLKGKTILIWLEQGIGDIIHLLRYIRLVKQEGARVMMLVPYHWKALIPLMKHDQNIDEILTDWAGLPPYDLHCPIFGLPLAFNTSLETIPPPTPFNIDPKLRDQWYEGTTQHTKQKSQLKQKPLRIGLVFHGGVHLSQADQRDLPPEFVSPLLEKLSGHICVHLQRDENEAYLPILKHHHVHLTHSNDFMELAALIQTMDLIIGVDTAIIHVAGTLGIKTHLLNRFENDWRWLKGMASNPWYPSITLHRQQKVGDWQSALDSLYNHL